MDIEIAKLTQDYTQIKLKKGSILPKGDLIYLYLELNLRKEDIGKFLGISPGRVGKMCIFYGLKKTKEQRTQCRNKTCLERYGKINVSQVPTIKQRKEETCLKHYGVKNGMQSDMGKQHYKETNQKLFGQDNFMKTREGVEYLQRCNYEKYRVTNPSKLEFVKAKARDKQEQTNKKIIETKTKNKSFNKSKPEKQAIELLSEIFTLGDPNHRDGYPFCCDIYVEQLNLFIELNYHWTHGREPYNPENPHHQKLLQIAKEKAKTSKYWANMITTWTIRDYNKIKIAKQNNLNYLVFYKKKEFLNWYNNIKEIYAK